jgi:hypothetical protein
MQNSILINSRKYSYFGHLFFCLTIFFMTLILFNKVEAKNRSPLSPIDGYWSITAEFEDFDINALVRFKQTADNKIQGITLGPTDGRDGSFEGKMSDGQILLNTLGPNGEMQVRLTVSDDKLSGTWSTNDKQGKINGVRVKPREDDSKSYSRYLKLLIESIDANFFDPNFNGLNPENLRVKYTKLLTGIKDDADFVQLMRQMLAEFKVSHLDFYLEPQNIPIKQKTPLIKWEKLSSQTGYLKIRSFEPISPTDNINYYLSLEKAFSELNSLPNLIIDLRDNPGGRLEVLFKTFGYFIPNGENIAYGLSRRGADKTNFIISKYEQKLSQLPIVQTDGSITSDIWNKGAVAIKANNSQNKLYPGRIVVLINENCFSSCELFAAILQENQRATVIGRTSGGAVLGAYTDSISKNMVIVRKDTGWRLQIPYFDFYTSGGKRLEGIGVTPNIEVKEHNGNKILEVALKYLAEKS